MSNYYNGLVSMKAEMKKADYICEEERSFEVPAVYYEGGGDENEETVFSWDTDSIFVVKNQKVIKYTKSTFSEMLIRDENGQTSWLDGRIANILGVNVNDSEDTRVSNEYRIEEYDLQKSIKRRYKVVLEESLDMDEQDLYKIKSIINKENNNL